MRFAIAKPISQPWSVAEQINRDYGKRVSQIKQVVITIQNIFKVSLVNKTNESIRKSKSRPTQTSRDHESKCCRIFRE